MARSVRAPRRLDGGSSVGETPLGATATSFVDAITVRPKLRLAAIRETSQVQDRSRNDRRLRLACTMFRNSMQWRLSSSIPVRLAFPPIVCECRHNQISIGIDGPQMPQAGNEGEDLRARILTFSPIFDHSSRHSPNLALRCVAGADAARLNRLDSGGSPKKVASISSPDLHFLQLHQRRIRCPTAFPSRHANR